MRKNVYMGAAALLATFSLSACGNDSNSSSNNGDSVVKEVDSVEDLGKCEKDIFGEIVYVAENDSLYECTSEGWVATDSSAIEKLLESSSANSDGKSSSSFKVDSSETKKIETVKVESVMLTGFAQKGPFEKGSAVTVYGLDSLLEKTKTKFTGKVSGDSGAYNVEKIDLPNQYALVEVNGNYLSEVTGKKTSGTKLKLNAIVDLSEGKAIHANVNIFTELEYARVKHLVAKEKFNVPAAKKRATKELLALFGSDEQADASLSSTDISLMDTTAAGTTLLSASILLSGELSVTRFAGRLGEIAEIFAATGKLDSAKLRIELADWAADAGSDDNYAAIYENVKAQKIVSIVPNFESVLHAFWTSEYGLEPCTETIEESVKKMENKLSDNYGAGYACTSKRWHKISELDTELGLCTAKKEGSFKENKGDKSTEYYVCRNGIWQTITETQFELKECTEQRNSEYVKTKLGDYFVCIDKQWQEIDSLSHEFKLCTEKRNLEMASSEKSGSYVCEWDGENGKWREATESEIVLYKLGECTSEKQDTVMWTGAFLEGIGRGNIPNDSSGGKYYRCNNKSWEETDKPHFVYGATCQSSYSYRYLQDVWASDDGIMDFRRDNFIITRFFENASGWTDKEINAYTSLFVVGKDTMENAICKNDVWTKITVRDFNARKVCNEARAGEKIFAKSPQNGETNYSVGYVCLKQGNSYAWQNGLVDTRDSTIYRLVTINGETWMAENLNYRYVEKTSKEADYDTSSYCFKNDVANCEKYGRLYIWSAAMDSAATWSTNGKGCGHEGADCSPTYPVRGICPTGSHLPDSTEWMNLYSFANSKENNLKSSTHDWSDNGTDAYGFTAYPAGQKEAQTFNIVTFADNGTATYFWSSTAREDFGYLSGTVFSLGTYNHFSGSDATRGLSIRCVKDK